MRILPLLLLLAPLAAQDPDVRQRPRFDIDFSLGGGRFEHKTDGSDLDDHTDAAIFRLRFEATTRHGIGGGIRIEGIGTDDDLFTDAGFNATEASSGSLFGHFTYRAVADRFAMPVRIGLLLNGYQLADQVTDEEVSYGSIGPYLEVAPEFTLFARRDFRWTLFGEAGVGVAATSIDVEGDYRDYVSDTTFAGLEFGTRFDFGPMDLTISAIGRWQSMAESDVEDGQVVLGYDSEFRGLMISFGATF